jgi:hypothetical protein
MVILMKRAGPEGRAEIAEGGNETSSDAGSAPEQTHRVAAFS